MSNKNNITFDRIFKEWYERLFFYAYHYLQDTEAARDVVHDAFEYIWRHRQKVDMPKAKAYLYTIVRSRCIDLLRQRNAQEDYVEFIRRMTEQDIPADDVWLYEERMQRIRRAMSLLTPLTRKVLETCYTRRKSYKEAAEVLDMSVSSIHKHIVKALRVIREEIQNDDPDR